MIIRYAYLGWIRKKMQRFVADSRRARELQHSTLLSKVFRNRETDFGRDHGFANIRSVADFRAQVPVRTFEDHRPYINRVLAGDLNALFAPGTRVLMFAMTSGTTGEPKRVPITAELFREYKTGWYIWAGGLFGDYPRLILKRTLQLSSDWQQFRAPSGVPCGQISGLAASTRPRIAKFMFLPPPTTTCIHDAAAKHYTTLRFALANRKVGSIMTANPSTLVEFARRANQQCESLLRDIHDGTLSCEVPSQVRELLTHSIRRRRPRRARELERLIETHGSLLPKHAWPALSVIAVWTGGSVGVFLPQLPELYGNTIVRDHGLSASEGRMTIPLTNGTSAGLLDFYHHYFEFIPIEEHSSAAPTVLEAHELEAGRDYYILLTTSGGLYRYDIHDVVRCVGFRGEAPMLEFLNKGKHFSNLTGEKLSEHQVVRAVERSFAELGLPIDCFAIAPIMEEQPRYILLVEPKYRRGIEAGLATRVQAILEQLNEEYASKCASGRIQPLAVREVPPGTWYNLRQQKTVARGNFEEYKHAFLVEDLSFVERITTALPATAPATPLPSNSPGGSPTYSPASA